MLVRPFRVRRVALRGLYMPVWSHAPPLPLTSPYKGRCLRSHSVLSHVTEMAIAARSDVF